MTVAPAAAGIAYSRLSGWNSSGGSFANTSRMMPPPTALITPIKHRTDRARFERGRLHRPGHGEQTQARGVEHPDRTPQTLVDRTVRDEHDRGRRRAGR